MTDLTAPHKHQTYLGRFWMNEQEIRDNLFFLVFADGTFPSGYIVIDGPAPEVNGTLAIPSLGGPFTIVAKQSTHAPLTVDGREITTLYIKRA